MKTTSDICLFRQNINEERTQLIVEYVPGGQVSGKIELPRRSKGPEEELHRQECQNARR